MVTSLIGILCPNGTSNGNGYQGRIAGRNQESVSLFRIMSGLPPAQVATNAMSRARAATNALESQPVSEHNAKTSAE